MSESLSAGDELATKMKDKLNLNGENEGNEDGARPRFVAPKIQENPNGWGPNTLPEQFLNLPFQFFNKSDRIGRVADWTGQTYRDDRRFGGRYAAQYSTGQVGTQYAYYHEDDGSTFQLVDTTKPQKSAHLRASKIRQMHNAKKLMQKEREKRIAAGYLPASGKGARGQIDRQRLWSRFQKQQFKQRQRFDPRGAAPTKHRQPSVVVKPEWEVVEEMDFPRLQKLSLPNVGDGEDIDNERYGTLEFYDKSYDRVTTRNPRPLQRINRFFYSITTTDDPVIEKLTASKPEMVVFGTDILMATIMCTTRSVYSWDIIVHRVGNKLFFDRRPNSDIESLTVSETATEPPQEEGNSLNSPKNLSLEAIFINRNFSQQVLKMGEEKHAFENTRIPFADPSVDPSNNASIGYRYRRWDLGNGVVFCCRCEQDGVSMGSNGEVQYLTIKALNEWDSRFSGGVEWRTKLDTQKSAVLATELKNNSCKVAKWTVQAILAGSDYLKFGYVSRVHNRDSTKHVILSTQQFKPIEFANQINLNMDNAWGVLRCIVDLCMKQPKGKYLLMKDPNKAVLRLYKLPQDEFESESEEESEDDDEIGAGEMDEHGK